MAHLRLGAPPKQFALRVFRAIIIAEVVSALNKLRIQTQVVAYALKKHRLQRLLHYEMRNVSVIQT